jgi:hypothetical protein
VTHTLDPATAPAHHNCSIRRASGFVQTRFSSFGGTVGLSDTWRCDFGSEVPEKRDFYEKVTLVKD